MCRWPSRSGGAFYVFSTAANAVGLPAASPYLGIAVLLTFAIAWSYFILLEWLGNGQTIGKRMFGLRVIADEGAPAGFLPGFPPAGPCSAVCGGHRND
jgi:uncharacterized RDD family membrane protein YckC